MRFLRKRNAACRPQMFGIKSRDAFPRLAEVGNRPRSGRGVWVSARSLQELGARALACSGHVIVGAELRAHLPAPAPLVGSQAAARVSARARVWPSSAPISAGPAGETGLEARPSSPAAVTSSPSWGFSLDTRTLQSRGEGAVPQSAKVISDNQGLGA